ncbi:uncharacterized protein LOC118278689 [Spodoptera frugiperda]|uniref:Uncharacterized protein LOC118278689 n=1 Tax=Spodoptera frugiperda TaxID=7108 RepID=A0A9R0E6S5_SPOFR|nr:uncharacterized protein LOC118278689 [Spodoptera frugiperda]
MVSLKSLIFFACVLAVKANFCTKETYGDTSEDYDVLLRPIILLKPDVANLTVTIPKVPECPHGAAGVKALACDDDAWPTIEFKNLTEFNVQRHGDLKTAGHVFIAIHCLKTP